jgi:hypothetical protein
VTIHAAALGEGARPRLHGRRIVERYRRPVLRVPLDRGLAHLDEGPFDEGGLLGGGGNAVEAAEEIDRGADRGEDCEETDQGQRFQSFHGPISG